jgi:hypothetical protein
LVILGGNNSNSVETGVHPSGCGILPVPSGGKKKSPDKFLFIVIYSQPLDKEKDGHTQERKRERPQLSADIGFESKGEKSVSWKGGYKELFISGQSRENAK